MTQRLILGVLLACAVAATACAGSPPTVDGSRAVDLPPVTTTRTSTTGRGPTGPTTTGSTTTGSTTTGAGQGAADQGLPDSIEVFADYPRYLWHERRLAIATTNGGPETATVTRIALRTDHFTPLESETKNSVVPAGSRVDIQADFGELVSCDDVSRSATVELDISVGDGPVRTVMAPLDPGPLDDILERECAELRIAAAATVEFADEWDATDDEIVTTLSITLHGALPVRIEAIRGTEIFAMQETADPALLPDDITADLALPIRLFVTRCDPHVVGQSTRTFEFKIWIGVDVAEPRLTVIDPTPDFQKALSNLIVSCIERRPDD